MIQGKIHVKPLSINKYYKPIKVRGHIEITISEAGKAYKNEVKLKISPKLTRLEPSGKYFAGLNFGFSNSAADSDNAVKPFQDAMVEAYNNKFGKSLNDKQIYFTIPQKVVVPEGQEFVEFFLVPLNLYSDLMGRIAEKMEDDPTFELFFKYLMPQGL